VSPRARTTGWLWALIVAGVVAVAAPLSTADAVGSRATVGLLAGAVGSQENGPLAHRASLPPPRFGQTLDIGLVSGTVIVTPPGRRPFTLGTVDRTIPIGSLIDTTHGRVDLRAAPLPGTQPARAAADAVQDAQFYDGDFRASQQQGHQNTVIRLAGGDFAQCTATTAARAPAAADGRSTVGAVAARKRLPHDVVRLLWASGPGLFETRGRDAAATVRGTIWLTEDFCDGTLVSVKRGVVSVDDLVHHRTVTVLAGHSYFAAAS
jgi:hypothetical protein